MSRSREVLIVELTQQEFQSFKKKLEGGAQIY